MDYFEEDYYIEDGNDYSETGGCKCDCRGECEPKGCQGLTGRRISSRSISGILLHMLYQSFYCNDWNALQGNTYDFKQRDIACLDHCILKISFTSF